MKHIRQILRPKLKAVPVTLLAILMIAGLLSSIVDVGARRSLFVESNDNPDLLELNTNFAERYQGEATPCSITGIPFKKNKEQHTVRIFIIGEPIYNNKLPYNPNASFSHILNCMLQQNIAGKSIELIPLAFHSASSFVQYDIARQLKEYSPDIVIVCPGRDEFYGDRTFSSNSFFRGNVWFNRYLANMHMIRTAGKLFKSDSPEQYQSIAYNSRPFKESLKAFEKNLEDMVLLLQQNGTKVVLMNTPSNLLDIRPQQSCFTTPDSARLKELFGKGKQAYLDRDFKLAEEYFNKIHERDRGHAETLYYLGQLSLLKNDKENARKLLELARQNDQIRFRSPSNINQIIFRSSVVGGCPLVDLEKSFSRFALVGIPGSDLFSGPQQLNLAGNILAAKACFEALVREHYFECKTKETVKVSSITPFDTLYDEICSRTGTRENPENKIAVINHQLVTSFEEEIVSMFAHREANWEDSMNKLYNYYIDNRNYEMALRVVENLALQNPYNININSTASRIAAVLGDSQRVVYYSRKIFKKQPSIELAQRIFIHYLKLDMPENALPYLKYVKKFYAAKTDYSLIYDATLRIVDLKKMLKKNPMNSKIRNNIAQQYYAIGNKEIAQTYSNSAEGLLR